MNLNKQQIQAIALKVSGEQNKAYQFAIETDEQLLVEIEIRNEFWNTEAYKKLQTFEKAQKVAGDLELFLKIRSHDCFLMVSDYTYTCTLEEWNEKIDSKIKTEAKNRLKNKYTYSLETIQNQIILATIDSSTLGELIQKVTLALSA